MFKKVVLLFCEMKLIFVGPQGSGKGTQAKLSAGKLGVAHISTGDLLRNASGVLKKKIDEIINLGKLVPDELMLEILKERMNKEDAKKGLILDGFPRNLKQARELDKIVKIFKVIEIHISDKESVKRLSGRWNCRNCGAIYNVNTFPKPKIEGKCDKCSGDLYQREDDKEEAIKKRLRIYHEETEPILKHYTSIKIDGARAIEKVSEEILEALGV